MKTWWVRRSRIGAPPLRRSRLPSRISTAQMCQYRASYSKEWRDLKRKGSDFTTWRSLTLYYGQGSHLFLTLSAPSFIFYNRGEPPVGLCKPKAGDHLPH